MKVVRSDKEEFRLRAGAREHFYQRILFDFNLVPTDVTPKHVVIEQKIGRVFREYKMAWRKFLKQSTVGDVVIIPREEFAYYENGQKLSGRMT